MHAKRFECNRVTTDLYPVSARMLRSLVYSVASPFFFKEKGCHWYYVPVFDYTFQRRVLPCLWCSPSPKIKAVVTEFSLYARSIGSIPFASCSLVNIS